MKVAVVTPYHNEPLEILKRCHDSVLSQTEGEAIHILAADGVPRSEIDGWDKVRHLKLPPHRDFGDTPRAIGALSAATWGAEAICFLDADNWFEPNHLACMIGLQLKTGAQVVTATRTLYRLDGTRLGLCAESNGRTFVDTNGYFLTRPTFPITAAWVFKPPADAIVGDRVFWNAVQKAGFTRAHCGEPTVNYTTSIASHYLRFGERPPPGAKVIDRPPGEADRRVIPYEEYARLTRDPPA
jgi:hypothetical protein